MPDGEQRGELEDLACEEDAFALGGADGGVGAVDGCEGLLEMRAQLGQRAVALLLVSCSNYQVECL